MELLEVKDEEGMRRFMGEWVKNNCGDDLAVAYETLFTAVEEAAIPDELKLMCTTFLNRELFPQIPSVTAALNKKAAKYTAMKGAEKLAVLANSLSFLLGRGEPEMEKVLSRIKEISGAIQTIKNEVEKMY